MKKIKILVLLISSVLIAPWAHAAKDRGGRGSATSVYVSFTSVGTGVDMQTMSILDNLIFNADQAGTVVEQNMKRRGREGETLYCVKLIDSFNRYHFIRSLAPSILDDTKNLGHQRTVVRLGFDCRSFAKATEQDLSKYVQ